jgi:protein SCO1/2
MVLMPRMTRGVETSSPDAAGAMAAARRAPARAGAALTAVAALSVLLPTIARAERTEPLPKELEGVGITEVPGARIPQELTFLDESGKAVRLADYFAAGRPVILTLNYYRCPMLCGLMLNGLLEGLKELKWTPGREFEIVTVSIDPLETPTLARLKKQSYMEDFARPEAVAGWHFLVGRPESIKALADAVGFHYRYNEERKEYAHPAGLFVATPDGRIARYLYGVVYEGRTLRLALTEAAEGKIGSSADQLLLFCFHYDAKEGRYVVAATKIMRFGGGATALILGLWLVTWWRRSARRENTDAGVTTT